jgi:hypothetical protein
VFCVGLGALSYALGLASKSQDWVFWSVQQTLLFPLLLLPESCYRSTTVLAGCRRCPDSTR